MRNLKLLFPSLRQLAGISVRQCSSKSEAQEVAEVKGLAYNHVEKKKGLYKPQHTIEEQIKYMASQGIDFGL